MKLNPRQLLLAAAVALLAGCGGQATTVQKDTTPAPGTVSRPGVAVTFVTLARRAISGTVKASGTIISAGGAQANLSFPIEGQIASVNVNVGDQVAAGQVLASLDGRNARSAVQQAEADVAVAVAALERTRAGARSQEIQSKNALVGGAQAKADAARAELRRQESLATAGIASRREVEQARAAYGDALADLRSKQAEGSLLLAGPRPQDVRLAQAQLQQAQAGLATAQTKASLLVITAPFSGTITARLKNPGETVDPVIQVLSMVDPQKTLVEVQLSEDQAGLVRQGNTAIVTQNGAQRPTVGTVMAVNSAFSGETRTLSARIRPTGGLLTPGASATAVITVKTLNRMFVVPESALVKDPDTGQALVFAAVSPGTYRKIKVQIVLQSSGSAAIAGNGLREGQRIVTQGAYELLPLAGG